MSTYTVYISRCLKYSFEDMNIQNEAQLGLDPSEMLWKLNVDHISFSVDTTFFLLSYERVACWWKEEAHIQGPCLRGDRVEGRVAPANSLRALGLLSCMSHLEGGPWGWIRAFSVVGWEAYLYTWSPLVSSLWDCMDLKLLTYRTGAPHSGHVLILQQRFGILHVAHPPPQLSGASVFLQSPWRKKTVKCHTVSQW